MRFAALLACALLAAGCAGDTTAEPTDYERMLARQSWDPGYCQIGREEFAGNIAQAGLADAGTGLAWMELYDQRCR